MSEAPPSDFAYERLSVNSLLAGRYQLVRYVGEGAAGSVYLAQDMLLDNREVAVKVLHASLANHGTPLERLRREVEITQGLTHPSVVQVYAFEPVHVGEDNRPTALLVMEYVEGSTLRAVLDQGVMREDEALAIFHQLVEALAFIHERGIVHRDIKPENIIVTKEGGIKLTDFGLAKQDTPMDLLTQSGQVMGTPGYMAPELYRGGAATPASDVYSLGLILYEMLYGEQLQRAEKFIASGHSREAGRIRRKLRWLDTQSGKTALILNECCAPDVASRPASAVALKHQLAQAQQFSSRVWRYALRRRVAQLARSTLRVTLVVALVIGLQVLYLGRIVSPYSLAHLYISSYLDRFQFTLTGGLLGLAPLDGTAYIRERSAYGKPNPKSAPRLGAEGRHAMLICGIEHQLPEFAHRLPPDFDDVGVGLTESCASYPLAEAPAEVAPFVSPLAAVARIGNLELFDDILAKVPNERISEDAIEQTYLHAVRMNRDTFVERLIARGLLPRQVSDQLLIEVLMAPSERIVERLLAAGVPFALHPSYLSERIARRSNPNSERWRKNLFTRHLQASRRIHTLQAHGNDLQAIREGLTPADLHAIATIHPDLVAVLAPLDVDWNVRLDKGMTPLLYAMNDRNNPAVEILIAQPTVDLSVINDNGMTALAFAVGKRRPDWIRAIQRRGVDMNTKIKLAPESVPAAPLPLLVPGNFVGLVDAVLQDPHIDMSGGINSEVSMLGLSMHLPTTKITELLLNRGADIAQRNRAGFAAIHVAAALGSSRHLQLLIAHGAEVNVRTLKGETPLMFAVSRENDPERAAILRLLLDAGADPFATTHAGLSVFSQAVGIGHSRAIGDLLDASGIDPFMQLPDKTSLFDLARGKAPALAELLTRERVSGVLPLCVSRLHLALGYLAAVPEPRRALPSLIRAIQERDLEAVRIHLAKGADPMTADSEGSALNHALLRRDREIFDVLLAHRPLDPNRVRPGQLSPLQIAAQNGDLASVEQLLAAGADPRYLNIEGNPVLFLAYASGRRAVVERLRRAAPDVQFTQAEQPMTYRDLEQIFGVPE